MQIKVLTGQGLEYPTTEEWQLALEDAGFENVQLYIKRFELAFANPYDVLKHMKLTGVSTNQTQTIAQAQEQTKTSKNTKLFIWSKSRLQQFESDYWQQFSARDKNGQPRVNLTYEVLIINAFKL